MPVIITSSKSSNLNYVDFGDIIQYEIILSNTGDTSISNLYLIDTIPSALGFTKNSVFINGINTPGYMNGYPMTLPSLSPSNTLTLTFEASVNGTYPFPNSFVNLANITFNYTVTSNTFSTSQLTNSVITSLNKALIGINKITDDFTGLMYPLPTTVVITNYGNTSAVNLRLRETLDFGMSLANTPIIQDGNFISGNLLTGISLPNLSPNQSTTISYNLLVNSLPATSTIKTFNNLSYEYKVDPTSTVNSTTSALSYYELTTVTSASLSATLSASPSIVILGTTVTYTLVVTNNGNFVGSTLNFTDTLPNYLSFNLGSIYINNVNYPSYNLSAPITLANLNANNSSTITFVATVTSIPSSNAILNTASLNYSSQIPNSSVFNSLATISNTVVVSALQSTVSLIKFCNHSFATTNSLITYSLIVSNLSGFNIFNATLFDTIPSGLAFIPNSIKVNSISQSGNPLTGIPLYTIPMNSIVTVTFDATVL